MIQAASFVEAAARHGFSLWSGVPCSYLKPFINFVIDAPDVRYVAAANEGDAVAIASGAVLSGGRAIAMFQNSGLGNAVNPLTSLNAISKIPVLLITTLRGEPGGPPDEPQHALMGPITTAMLDVMCIPWEYFPSDETAIEAALQRAVETMDQSGQPFAFVMKKDSVAPCSLKSKAAVRPLGDCPAHDRPVATATRRELLGALRASLLPGDALIATTGFTGRELYALGDTPDQFYMVGSMGCASSLALGVALSRPGKRVIAIDGDGALLMRLGALATNGYERPGNMVHILLDNGVHESTGGQGTVSASIDFCRVAAACGYRRQLRVNGAEALAAALAAATDGELTFIHAFVKPGVPDDLPRPKVTPEEVARRFAAFLRENP